VNSKERFDNQSDSPPKFLVLASNKDLKGLQHDRLQG
jgi:hypothetical protein